MTADTLESLANLYISDAITADELAVGVNLAAHVLKDEANGTVSENRIVKNRDALTETLLANNSIPFVKWMRDNYYKGL